MPLLNKTNNEQELPCLIGTVEHITFHNENNGYTVCQIALLEHERGGNSKEGEIITIVGSLPLIAEGEKIQVMGNWKSHPTFGRQFEVIHYEKTLPSTAQDMEKYLSSRAVKGIGPVTASKIVERFGVDTFDVIEKNPEFLTQINGISAEKAEAIGREFRSQFGMRGVILFCRDYFGAATSIKIYKKLGSGAVDKIKCNPYILCEQINGIGFERADKVAFGIGFAQNAPERIRSGITYVLYYNASNNGHTYLPRAKLIKASCEVLGVEKEEVQKALDTLLTSGSLIESAIDESRVIYLKTYREAELFINKKLSIIDGSSHGIGEDNIENIIEQIEFDRNIKYAVKQKKAIHLAAKSGICVFTGGPGTGKTTVISAVIELFSRMNYKIALAAPTGRAAKRMSEATSREAATIHRLLEVEWGDDDRLTFRRNEDNKLEEDVIIIDETSMVDTLLMSALLEAIRPGAKLILIGDVDQLPSVGAGNVLCDIIDSERFSTVKLTEIFRQASGSLIVTNAHSINSGQMPILSEKNGDFFFIERAENDITATITDLVARRLPTKYDDARGNIQVITPCHKGSAGTIILNNALQNALNPTNKAKNEIKYEVRTLRAGDRVMQIKNNYNIAWTRKTLIGDEDGQGVFNGDIGIISAISRSEEKLAVTYDEKTVTYDFSELDQLEHAYAITIHKSQGSEYPYVIIPIFSYAQRMLTRELFYTAVTRAQKIVILVGSRATIHTMVENEFKPKRYTGLFK